MNEFMLYPLALVRKHFDQAATHYDAHAVVQREIADRLLDHLDGLSLAPKNIIDVGCGTGYCSRLLKQRYPSARITGVDLSPAMIRQAKKQRRWFSRNPDYVVDDAQSLSLEDNSVDLLVSSLAIQWCDPDKTFSEFARVLKPGGLLLLSSFGPDTLTELRIAWTSVDPHQQQHVHTFIDMHDLGDAMVRNGLAAPVLDVDRLVLTYKKVGDIMRDLKGIGAQNLAPDRPRGLMGKTLFKSFCEAYEKQANGQALQVTYEAVFAHAWAPKTDMSGETVIPFPPPIRRR